VINLLPSPTRYEPCDQRQWYLAEYGCFAVKSFCSFLDFGGSLCPYQHIWKVPVPFDSKNPDLTSNQREAEHTKLAVTGRNQPWLRGEIEETSSHLFLHF